MASRTNLAACHFCTSFLDQNIEPLQDKGRLQVSQNPPNKVGLAAVQLFLSLHFLKWTRGTEIVCLQTIETGEGIAQLCMQPHDKQRGSKRCCCDLMQDIISIRLRDSSSAVDHILFSGIVRNPNVTAQIMSILVLQATNSAEGIFCNSQRHKNIALEL